MAIQESKWAKENRLGRIEADAIIERMKKTGCPLELARRLDPDAKANGVDIGLFFRIVDHLLLTR